MVSAGLVQTKGLEVALCSRMYRRIASWWSGTDLKTPRLMRLLVRLDKKPLTALSQDAQRSGDTILNCIAAPDCPFPAHRSFFGVHVRIA